MKSGSDDRSWCEVAGASATASSQRFLLRSAPIAPAREAFPSGMNFLNGKGGNTPSVSADRRSRKFPNPPAMKTRSTSPRDRPTAASRASAAAHSAALVRSTLFRSGVAKGISAPVALSSARATRYAFPRAVSRKGAPGRGTNRPARSTSPARKSSAHRSRIPDPQTPAGFPPPITVHPAARVSRSIRTESIAPGQARIPHATSPPSNAGPAEEEQAIRNSRFPSATSPLVPTSNRSDTASSRCMPDARMPATMSPPTNPPMEGKIRQRAESAEATPRSLPDFAGYSFSTGLCGGRRTDAGERP